MSPFTSDLNINKDNNSNTIAMITADNMPALLMMATDNVNQNNNNKSSNNNNDSIGCDNMSLLMSRCRRNISQRANDLMSYQNVLVMLTVLVCGLATVNGLKCNMCGQYNEGVGSITPCLNYSDQYAHLYLKECSKKSEKYCVVSVIKYKQFTYIHTYMLFTMFAKIGLHTNICRYVCVTLPRSTAMVTTNVCLRQTYGMSKYV